MKHFAGQYYHIYNRGVDRQPIFSNDENYRFLLRRAKGFLPSYPVRIVAYCLMPNHYHFLVGVDKDGALSPFFQRLFNSYSQAFNLQQGRKGTLFESRAKSKLVEDASYVYALARYIHLNPVLAHFVQDPAKWPFSDYLEWTTDKQGEFFDPEFRAMFFSSPEEYRQYVLTDVPEAMERKLTKYYLEDEP